MSDQNNQYTKTSIDIDQELQINGTTQNTEISNYNKNFIYLSKEDFYADSEISQEKESITKHPLSESKLNSEDQLCNSDPDEIRKTNNDSHNYKLKNRNQPL